MSIGVSLYPLSSVLRSKLVVSASQFETTFIAYNSWSMEYGDSHIMRDILKKENFVDEPVAEV
jgi:hypothetical protein